LLAFAPGIWSAEPARSDDQAMIASPRAVFLHGGWRCGSTYVWSRFRECAQTLCFYEPFHEGLARCNAKRIRRDTTLTWNSRHPLLSRPYWEEYLPLLRGVGLRGVRGYREEFAVANYFPDERGPAQPLRYLSRLAQEAQRSGKQPVFGFSRSLARAAAIKRALGGLHIVIRRNPRQQWLSCRSYRVAEGTVYFELCHFLILALAPVDSPAGVYARHLGLPRPPPGRFRNQFRFMQQQLGPLTDELSYRAFIGVHQLSHEAAACSADLTIDVDRLSSEQNYRSAVRAAIFARSGLVTRFDDCQIGSHDMAAVAFDFASVESDVFRLLRACGANVPPEIEHSLAIELPCVENAARAFP
jgi:hypothetical protein